MQPGVPQYYAAPFDALLPAKRASLMMFIMGPLILLTGACMASVPSMVHMVPPTPEFTQAWQQMEDQLHGNAEIKMIAGGSVSAVIGLAMLILAFFVRGGGRTACIFGTTLVGLLSLYSAMNLLAGLFIGNIPGVCMSVLMFALFGLTLAWLIQAIRASRNVSLAQQQYAAQYWHYQQTMQAYANAGYGYGVPSQGQPPVPQTQIAPPPPNPETPPGT
jgi:hypothetical protein